METITSRENPSVKEYIRLRDSRGRRREQRLFVTEGFKLTAEAYRAGCPLKRLFFTEPALTHEKRSPRVLPMDTAVCISQGVAEKMADSITPQGVFGLFGMLDKGAQPVKIEGNGAYLVLCGLQDPGNLGTILRTACAFGADGIFLTPDCPDPYGLKVLRGSMGGVFHLPLMVAQAEETMALLKEQGVFRWAAALHQDAKIAGETPLDGGAVFIGNEGNGLPKQIVEGCDGVLALPMCAESESLNAAMAAGILLWEMTKKRLFQQKKEIT